MDVLKRLKEMNMELAARKILSQVSEGDLINCRKVSRVWKRLVDEEVVEHWSFESKMDWRWTFGPMRMKRLDLEAGLGLVESPRNVEVQEVFPIKQYVVVLVSEYDRLDDTMLVFKGCSGELLASVPVPHDERVKTHMTEEEMRPLWKYEGAKIIRDNLLLIGERGGRMLMGESYYWMPNLDDDVARVWCFSLSEGEGVPLKYSKRIEHLEYSKGTVSVLDMLTRQHVFWIAQETVPGEGCKLSVHLLEPESGDTLVLKTGAEFSSDGEALRPCGAQWMTEGADRLYSVFVRNERSDDKCEVFLVEIFSERLMWRSGDEASAGDESSSYHCTALRGNVFAHAQLLKKDRKVKVEILRLGEEQESPPRSMTVECRLPEELRGKKCYLENTRINQPGLHFEDRTVLFTLLSDNPYGEERGSDWRGAAVIFVDAEKGEVVGGGNGEGCLLVPCGEPDEAHFEVVTPSMVLIEANDLWESESIEIPAKEKSEKKDDDERTPVASAYLCRLSSGDHSVHKRRRNITKEMHKMLVDRSSSDEGKFLRLKHQKFECDTCPKGLPGRDFAVFALEDEVPWRRGRVKLPELYSVTFDFPA